MSLKHVRVSRLLAALSAAALLAGTLAGCGKTNPEKNVKETAETKAEGKETVAKKAETVELKLGLTPSESSIWMIAVNSFKEEVEEKTEGRYEISVYPSEQLAGGDLIKGIEMLLTGSTDIALNSVMNASSFDSRLSVTSMPWLFAEGYDSVDKYIFNGEGADAIKEIFTQLGAVPLALGDNGFRQITNNKTEIKNPEDLSRLKIRTPANAMYIDLFKQFQADPTSMNFSEVYTALQNGTIDGQENPIDTINSARIQEVSKYLTLWNYSYDLFVLSTSKKLWNSLSEEDQKIFQEAADNACQKEIEQYRENENTLLEAFKKDGNLTITELSSDQIQAFQEAAVPVYEKYREEIGEELFAKFGYTFQ